MKNIMWLFVTIAIVFTIPLSAFAATGGGTAFALYSAASGTVRTSSAISIRDARTKTLTVSGATLTSNASTATFKNMSGTVLVQCGPTSSGPWSTCIANDYAQTAVSRTTNGIFTWADAAAYIRLQWTGGTLGTKLKAWLNWLEE